MEKDKQRILQRYNELIDKVKKYNYHYYDLDQPLVDDAEYDELMNELIALEEQYPGIKNDTSPANRVGGAFSKKFSEVRHDPPMLSLGNVFSEQDLLEFDARCRKNLGMEEITYSMELKFDGLAVEIAYEDGRYVQGSTRGNGTVGEDVTANLATVKSLPLLLGADMKPGMLQVRGEVFMRHGEFERLNREKQSRGEPLFANPRNAAAGSLRQLDSKVSGERRLDIALYGTGMVSPDLEIYDLRGMYDIFSKAGLPSPDHVAFGNIDEVRAFYSYWMENRHNLDYDIDGVVVKINDFTARDRLGATSKAPRWAAAWKFPAREAITTVESVDCQVGRTGVVTPVANLHPINIGGVLVKRASLHNFNEINRLRLRVGDSVRVKRAGDVIPKVVEVIEDKRGNAAINIVKPVNCPVCAAPLLEEDIYIRCVNPECEGKRLESLKFFVSKEGMDIEYFGPELVQRLYGAGRVKSPADIFTLTIDDLLKVERMGDRLAAKIVESIRSRKRAALPLFLRSLGIRNVGDHLAKVISRNVKSIDELYEITAEDLENIKEVGPGTADSVYEYFHDDSTRNLIEQIRDAGVEIYNDTADTSDEIDEIRNKTFVVTGTLERFSRKQIEEFIERSGGRSGGTVSGKTDFLIAGASAGSKLKKAVELGVRVLTEDEFLRLIGRDH